MLELKDIYFRRDNKNILNGVSLKIEENTFTAITGPNGSGKSTLAKIIMGIEKPDRGQILFDGVDVTNMSIDERARLGMAFAFQQPVKFKGITVYDMIRLSAKKEINKAEACNILSKVGLCAKEYVDREINNSLSGGELKRIEIASVVARGARLTVFDEPEAGIDLWSFNDLIKVFESIRGNIKGATLIISHQERILNIADKVVLVKDGKSEEVNKGELLKDVTENAVCCKLK